MRERRKFLCNTMHSNGGFYVTNDVIHRSGIVTAFMTTSVTFDAAILLMIRAVHFNLRSCSQHVSRISCAMCGNFLRFHMESFRETSKLLKLCDILCNQNTDLPYRLDTKPMHRDPYLQNYMVHTLKSSSCKYKQIHTIVLSTNDAFHSSRTIVIMS
jgi:hypothetical protein